MSCFVFTLKQYEISLIEDMQFAIIFQGIIKDIKTRLYNHWYLYKLYSRLSLWFDFHISIYLKIPILRLLSKIVRISQLQIKLDISYFLLKIRDFEYNRSLVIQSQKYWTRPWRNYQLRFEKLQNHKSKVHWRKLCVTTYLTRGFSNRSLHIM